MALPSIFKMHEKMTRDPFEGVEFKNDRGDLLEHHNGFDLYGWWIPKRSMYRIIAEREEPRSLFEAVSLDPRVYLAHLEESEREERLKAAALKLARQRIDTGKYENQQRCIVEIG